jgi:D-2-hydroxyacid dehydrogenase (NADP+)
MAATIPMGAIRSQNWPKLSTIRAHSGSSPISSAYFAPSWAANSSEGKHTVEVHLRLEVVTQDLQELNAAILQQSHRLRWLHVSPTGVDKLPLETIRRTAVLFTNGAGLQAPAIAEHTVMCMLAARRNLAGLLAAKSRSKWSPELGGDAELAGATALILGFGHIGRAIATLARALGVHVVGARRRPSIEPHVMSGDAWRELLPRVDFVVIALPQTHLTVGLIGRHEFKAMKPGTWLINVGRGSAVDESALIEALGNGTLGGAALDALPHEPLPAEHPLWQLHNVILTPHVAYKSARTDERATKLFLDNLTRFRAGEPLLNVVDSVEGY